MKNNDDEMKESQEVCIARLDEKITALSTSMSVEIKPTLDRIWEELRKINNGYSQLRTDISVLSLRSDEFKKEISELTTKSENNSARIARLEMWSGKWGWLLGSLGGVISTVILIVSFLEKWFK